MKKDTTLIDFLSVIYISYFGMNKSNYNIRENIGALAAGTVFGGFWIPVLEQGNFPIVGTMVVSASWAAGAYYGYNYLKNDDKQRENVRNRTFSKERDLIDILEE